MLVYTPLDRLTNAQHGDFNPSYGPLLSLRHPLFLERQPPASSALVGGQRKSVQLFWYDTKIALPRIHGYWRARPSPE